MKRLYILIFILAAGLVFAALSFLPALKHQIVIALRHPAGAPSNQSVISPSVLKVETNAKQIPGSVLEAVNRQKPYDERIAALENIKDMSAPGAQAAMIEYLLQPLPRINAAWGGPEYELRNNMLNKLREHPADPRAVTEALLKIYSDSNQGDVMRGYAIQHIAGWIRTGVLSSGDQERLLDAVRDAATNVDNPAIGGAGLIALREAGPEDEAASFAMDALGSANACPESRISAFQVCAELGEEDAIGPARAALMDRNASAILHMSAVNVLARLGGPAEESLLQEMAGSSSGVISGQTAGQSMIAGRYNNDELVRNAARLALASRSKGR